MKLLKAIRVVGFEITMSCNKDPFPGGVVPVRDYWRATGSHPAYGYSVIAYDIAEHHALGKFVDVNYRIISQAVFNEQFWRCLNCGKSHPLTIDHIIPRSHGRSDARENLRALCVPCHEDRHTNGGRNWQPVFTLRNLEQRHMAEQ